MLRELVLLVCLPVIIVAILATPLALDRGPYHWLCAGVALGLTVPAAAMSFVCLQWLNGRSPFSKIYAVFLGTVVRLVVGFGGGVLVFELAQSTFRASPLSFWLWLLTAYLVTLVTEVILTMRLMRPVNPLQQKPNRQSCDNERMEMR